jgi:dUTPase
MEGCYGIICDRSGLALRGVSRRGGVIDPDFDQEWKVILVNDTAVMATVEVGDRIGQVLFIPLPEIEVVGEGVVEVAAIRNGGFGSTGE